MAQTSNDIKNGSVINLDGKLWKVIKFQHVKPGKGPAFVRTTIQEVLSGKIVDKTFNAGTKLDFETVDNRNLQYSYRDGDNFVFMDMQTFDQVMIPESLVGSRRSSSWKAPTASSPSMMATPCPWNCPPPWS